MTNMPDTGAPKNFTVVADPAKKLGDLRVSMTATLTDSGKIQLFYAENMLWEDDYAFHLQHSGGMDIEVIRAMTKRLNQGDFVTFSMTCCMHQLEAIGFIGVSL